MRSDTSAQKQITSTVAAAARAVAAKDSELVDRVLERWTRQLAAKQEAREVVALRTINVLAEEELLEGASVPSEDFMRMFEEIVEKTSSAELADLMARILAGEIRKPGSISRRTLQVVAVLDQEIVSALNDFRPYLLDSSWVHVPPSKQEWRQRFALLASVSITSEVSVRGLHFDANNQSGTRIGDKGIVVTSKPSKTAFFIDGANLTPIGMELVSTLPLITDVNLREIALGMKEYSYVEKVEIGDIANSGDESGHFEVREVF